MMIYPPRLNHIARWQYLNPAKNTFDEEHEQDCYSSCRRAHDDYNGFNHAIKRGWTHIRSSFHYMGNEISSPEVDWWWNTCFLPSIPDEVKPHVRIADGSFRPTRDVPELEVQYKTLTVDFTKLSWDDILILFTWGRTMQEHPFAIHVAHQLANKYPKCTPDMAFFFGLTYHDCHQPAHVLLSARWQAPVGWDEAEVQQYSFKQRWSAYTPKYFLDDSYNTHINATFKLDSGHRGWTQNNRFLINRGQYLKKFIRMVK